MSLKKNFASRLSLYVLLLTAGLMLVVTLLSALFAADSVKREADTMASKVLDNAILEIEQVITEVERAVDNVDWLVEQNISDEQFLYTVTRELVMTNPNIIGSAVAFEPGYFKGRPYFAPYSYEGDVSHEIHSMQMGNEQYDYPTLDWYQIPKLLGRPYWSEPYYDDGGSGQRISTYSMPLRDADGQMIGILTADISLAWLSEKVASIKPYENAYTFMIGRNGAYIAHTDPEKVLNETIFTSALEMTDTTALYIGREMVAGHRGMVPFMNDDARSFMVFGPLSNGWSMGLVCTYRDIYHDVMGVILFLGALLLLGLLGLFFGTRSLIRKQTMPIVEFTNSAMTIAKGNFKAKIPEVRSTDELRKLRDSLNYMQQSINDYIQELKTTTASNERYESELNIAREIQMSMLPQNFPKRPDCDLYAMVQPAKEVGGDLYDFIEVGNRLFFLVGDVSGKGVPAALFMAITRAAFRFIGALGLSMSEVVSRVNNCLCDGNKNEMFVTLFAGSLDLETGEMAYCNAGHNPIVVISPDGSASFLRAKPNLAAGLFENFPYQDEMIQLEPGTRLVLYTDGVTEAEREDKTQFGDQALLTWAEELNRSASSNASVLDLYSHVKAFTHGADQNDDITILSIHLKNNNHSLNENDERNNQ
ncbi:MAG: SpoIIE family protein phosphatase [Bacteroidales bacterium]|nr:SpoIIE family protein phosphatase [Bacteroidales bacterium]